MWLLITGTLLFGGIAAVAISVWRKETAPAVKPTPTPIAKPVFEGNELTLAGKVRAQHVVSVPAPIEGTLDMVLVEAGQDVFEGQLLVRIKNQLLETAQEQAVQELERAQNRVTNYEGQIVAARLEAARADADSARAQSEAARLERAYARQQLLHREGATPRLTFEKAQKEYETAKEEADTARDVAKAAGDRVAHLQQDLDQSKKAVEEKTEDLEGAKADLAAAEVHSPVDGVVVAAPAQAGTEVHKSATDLFQIAVDLSLLEAVLEPDPLALERVKPGQAAVVTAVELGNEPIEGRVKEVKDNVVVVEFASPDPALKPGLTVQVKIKLT
jgi:multidrug resistance efflux pump